MTDVLLSELAPALDLYVIERRSDSSFVAVTSPPAWLTPALGAGADTPFALAQTFPFLEGFLREAETFWRAGTERRLTSDVFTAGDGSEELLLRASALNVSGRCVIVLERLHGAADARPVLQTAREQALAHERLASRVSGLQTALASISKLATRLIDSGVQGAEREIADAGTSYGALMPGKSGISPLSAFAYIPCCSR
jgi:hypothetical protein